MSNPAPIPWFEPFLDEADANAVKAVVTSGFVNEGPANRAFEKKLTEFFGVAHAVTAPNCTTSIAIALKALGVGHGDTVLVPDITFVGTASAVRLAGAEPILVDVDAQSFTMDPADAQRRITKTTKAMVPVHLNGRSCDMRALMQIARDHGLAVVEDAAEAIASRNADGWLGTLADAGCFSLAPTKLITSGQGGFVLTNRQDVRDGLVRLKDHGRLSRASDVHPCTGFNLKVTDMQGALALSQWGKLPSRIERAREIDRLYVEGLSDIEELEFTPRPTHGGYLMWPDFKCRRRNDLVEHLKKNAITPRPYWPALHRQPAYASNDSFPGATDACEHACWLPCSPAITNEQIARIISVTREFFGAPRS